MDCISSVSPTKSVEQNQYLRECAKRTTGKPALQAVAAKAVAAKAVPPTVVSPAPAPPVVDSTPAPPAEVDKWSADACDEALASTAVAEAPVSAKRARRFNPYCKVLQKQVMEPVTAPVTEQPPSFCAPQQLTVWSPIAEHTMTPPCSEPELDSHSALTEGGNKTPEVAVPPVPSPNAGLMSVGEAFNRRARCRNLSKEMKPCKFDQLIVPGLGGLEAVQGLRGIMPVSTTKCAQANKDHGAQFANATGFGRRQGLRAPFYADGVDASELHMLPRCHAGCITAMYDGPTVADLVFMLTGVWPAAVIDKPARNHYGNGVWQVFFFSEMDKFTVMSFTGRAVTGDAGVWMFEREALDGVLGWVNGRNAYLNHEAATTFRSTGAKYIREDGTVTHGMSPVSFEEPTQVVQQRRQKPP